MQKIKLIADSGSTKTEWCLLNGEHISRFFTEGLSPYFLNSEQIQTVFEKKVLAEIGNNKVDEIYFYGTGCKSDQNKEMFNKVFDLVFHASHTLVRDDMDGAARGLFGKEKGIACILGTGSNSCYYDGERIVRNSPGLGFILGDEGSGAILGKSLIQHYLYNLMDDYLQDKFDEKFHVTRAEILDSVYWKPRPNRYLAAFTIFLSENRGNYMVENILEDELNKFFYTHLVRYPESSLYPVGFVGSIGYVFRDVIISLCTDYGFKTGKIIQSPMDGLIQYHQQD